MESEAETETMCTEAEGQLQNEWHTARWDAWMTSLLPG